MSLHVDVSAEPKIAQEEVVVATTPNSSVSDQAALENPQEKNWKLFRKQQWPTWKSFKRVKDTAVCPRCGQHLVID